MSARGILETKSMGWMTARHRGWGEGGVRADP